MKKQEGVRGIFPPYFSIPKGDPAEKIKSIKKNFEKFQKGRDYLVSGSVNEYLILSKEMKKSIRDIIWEKIPGKEEGHFFGNHYFSYQEGINGSPDKFIMLSEDGEIDGGTSGLIEIDDEEAEKQKAKGVETISNQEIEKKDLENKKGKDDKKMKGELIISQENQVGKGRDDKKNKGGNNAPLLIGSVVSLLVFGLFLVGLAGK